MQVIEQLYELFAQSKGVSTDTRKEINQTIFFCLSGEHFNGNTFAAQALQKGALCAVIDDPTYAHLPNTILVANALETLQKLATHHRQILATPIIAITGTNGKTTTKELISSVLATSFEVIFTQGNLNNHIGVPLTLLQITPSTEIAIVEMGANHPKEIEALCQIAQPDYGYITNFGKAHLEGFGSLQGVIEAKSELYNFLMAKNGVVFFDFDNPIQREKTAHYPKAYGYSLQENQQAYLPLRVHTDHTFVGVGWEENIFTSSLVGNYNAANIAAAITIGRYFRLTTEQIKKGIAAYHPKNNRSELQMGKNGNTLLLDAYNANPSSMLAALEHFKSMEAPSKVLILGDMRELGSASHSEHQAIADYLKDFPAQTIVLIGEAFGNTQCAFTKIPTTAQAAAWITQANLHNSLILIKGSRGMHLEQVQAVLV